MPRLAWRLWFLPLSPRCPPPAWFAVLVRRLLTEGRAGEDVRRAFVDVSGGGEELVMEGEGAGTAGGECEQAPTEEEEAGEPGPGSCPRTIVVRRVLTLAQTQTPGGAGIWQCDEEGIYWEGTAGARHDSACSPKELPPT